jgi:transposase
MALRVVWIGEGRGWACSRGAVASCVVICPRIWRAASHATRAGLTAHLAERNQRAAPNHANALLTAPPAAPLGGLSPQWRRDAPPTQQAAAGGARRRALRAARLGRDLGRWQDLQIDIALADEQLEALLAQTPGQVLTSLPGVAIVRAAAFSAFTLPIERWPTPEHLYSATGLAPATYQSSTVTRRARISRQGLPEHRDALMGIAWGLATNSDAFRARDAELRARGFRALQARVALARHACRLCWRLLNSQQPFDERRYARARRRGR